MFKYPLNLGFGFTSPFPHKSLWTFIADELNTALKDKIYIQKHNLLIYASY